MLVQHRMGTISYFNGNGYWSKVRFLAFDRLSFTLFGSNDNQLPINEISSAISLRIAFRVLKQYTQNEQSLDTWTPVFDESEYSLNGAGLVRIVSLAVLFLVSVSAVAFLARLDLNQSV